MKLTTNYKLKKPEGADVVNVDDLNDNFDIIDVEIEKKVEKVAGKYLSTNDFTTAEKNKLSAIDAGATKYVHPTGAGNNHIPAGGAVGQVLKNTASGVGSWQAEKDTVTTINGKTGAIAKADIVALGIPAQDTVYTHPGIGTNPHGTTKSDVGLWSVENYGIATTAEAQAGASNAKYMTPALVKAAIQYLATTGGISMVKSVQRGVATFTGEQLELNIPISAINIAKSILLIESFLDGRSSTAVVSEKNLSSNNIKIVRNINWSAPVFWQVIEYM